MAHSEGRPVALVTGGRQGLGRGIGLALAASGFDLVVLDLQEDERAEQTLADLGAAGARAVFIRGDIADLSSHARIVDAAWAAFGRVDCLVDNAGVAARPLTDVLDLSPEAFDFNLGINLRGTFFLTQAVAKRMLATPDGESYRSIIVITSIAAEHVSVDRAQYCISKAGLSMVAKLFAVRLAEAGIHVHEVRPGFIRTDMTGSASTEKLDRYIAGGAVPLRRWGQAPDVGQTVAMLASGALPYATGQAIYVDGGFNIPVA